VVVSETKNLFRNTAAQSAPIVSTFVFSFLLAPLMLSRLGLAQFGVWAVTGALAQYARLLDLGVTTSLARFVALHDAEGDRRGIEETIGVGVLMATLVGLLVIAAAALAAGLVSDVVGVLDTADMRIVLLCSAAISTTYLIDGVITAIPVGLRRMGPPNVALTAGNVVNFAFSVLALLISTELTTYALANLAAAVVSLAFVAVSLLWVWERPFLSRPSVSRSRTILSFGVKSQLVTLANLVSVQTDKLIIAAMLGPRTAGAYDIGNRVVQGVFSLGVLTLSALIPTATADLVKRGKQVIAEYFTRYTVRSLAIALPMFGALCVSAPYLLVAWLGERPPDSVETVVLLSAAFAVSMSTGVAMTLTVSDGHPGLVAQTAAIVVVLNIAGTLVAAPLFGLWGVLVATVAAEMVAGAIFIFRFHRRYSLGAGDFSKAVLRPLTVTLVTAVPFGLWYLLFAGELPDSRGPALVGTLATGGVYAVVCWLTESRMGVLPEKLSVEWLRRRFARTSNVPG
jgi:O-antigen/teichoic acid export membrane protein